MSTAPASIETAGETNIVEVVNANPVMVLTDREKFNRFYEEMKRETDAMEVDLTTDKGRKAIASMARRIATTKVLIDDAGKKLNEEARERINAIDAARREIRQQLDALKEEVRRPLTEWEKAEEARIIRVQDVITQLRHDAAVGYEETSADVRERLNRLKALVFDEVEFDGYGPQANSLREQAVEALATAAERLDREEAERAELERLRAEKAAREAEEARIAAAQEQARLEAEEQRLYEERRAAAEKAEQERIQREREEAANAAREEEARKAREAEAARQREHEAQLAEERRQREEAERMARQEQERRAAEEAEAARQAEENRKREANRAHRTRVQRAAKEAIMTCGADEDTARKIVLAIIAGEIPAVSLAF